MSNETVYLTGLVAPPYQLAYAIPLLVISVPVTFAGAFLTLDRTRSFVGTLNRDSPWRLEGGIGGIAGGWLFGVHLSTFLCLVIMNMTSVAPMGPVYFLVIWILSSVAMAVVAGRWKIVALLFLGIEGGAALALLNIVVFTPSITIRIILTSVFVCVLPLLCLLPFPALQHGPLRFSCAIVGSFSIIVAGAILGSVHSWADIWSRLWIAKSEEWGDGQEKGLSAAVSLLCLLGVCSDYLLKRKFGENPDQKWDSYLASYAANLPNAPDRAGTFQPVTTFWSRLFHPQPTNPIAFPGDPQSDPSSAFPTKLKSRKSSATTTLSPATAPKFRSTGTNDALLDESSSSSDSDEDSKRIPRPWAGKRSASTTLSGTTAHDDSSNPRKGKQKVRGALNQVKQDLEYSDGESVKGLLGNTGKRDSPGWKPGFIYRHSSDTQKQPDLEKGFTPLSRKTSGKATPSSHLTSTGHDRTQPASPPPGVVPATPSLLNALDRVALAQTQAYGGASPRTPKQPEQTSTFWQEVAEKAHASPHAQSRSAFPFPRPGDGK